jgi:hypothetical protein
MDQSLFSKYKKQVDAQKEKKKEVQSFIKIQTGIELEDEEIEFEGKEVTLHISSIKRNLLHTKKLQEQAKKYNIFLKL